MITVSGTLRDAAGNALPSIVLTIVSNSTPLVEEAGGAIGCTDKVITTDPTTGAFSIGLKAGIYNFTFATSPRATAYQVTLIPADDGSTVDFDDVVSSNLIFTQTAPNTVWNGTRKGHITFQPRITQAEANAATITFGIVAGGTGLDVTLNYNYKLSFLDSDGMEAPGGATYNHHVESSPDPGTLILTVSNIPQNAAQIRIWRNLMGGSQYFLLGTVPISNPVYHDTESDSAFSGRLTLTTIFPVVNTTGGGLKDVNSVAQIVVTDSGPLYRYGGNLIPFMPKRAAYVSAIGLASGATVANDGAPFGPDTPGTTTSGIQEAMNSLVTGAAPEIGGGMIVLGHGDFNCTGQIVIPVANPFNLIMEGAGEGGSRLIYNGATVQDFIVLSDQVLSHGNNNQLNAVFKNFGMFYTNDTNKACLMRFVGANQFLGENLFFSTTAMLSSAPTISAFKNPLVYYAPPTHALGTIGLRVDSGANRLTLRNCAFHGLAVGCIDSVDHSAFEDCIFSVCGQYAAVFGTNSWGTLYTGSGSGSDKIANNCAAWGGGLFLISNTYECTLTNPQFFNCNAGIGVFSSGFGPNLTIHNPMFESMRKRIVLSPTPEGDDPSPVLMFHGMANGGSGADDACIDFNTGASITAIPFGPLPVLEFSHTPGLADGVPYRGYCVKAEYGGRTQYVFGGEIYAGNWFAKGGLAIGQDGPVTGSNMLEVAGGPIGLPKFTKAQRDALSSPQDAALIYQTDNTPGPRYRVSGAWYRVALTADP